MSRLTIWFWQRMLTPHMAYLALSLWQRGHDVTYVTEEEMSAERAAMGWQLPDLLGVTVRFAANARDASALVRAAPTSSVHLTQGFRSNGNISSAQATIRAHGHRHFVVMETVRQQGLRGLAKPAVYWWHFHRWRDSLEGVLAIGADTPAWISRLAPSGLAVYPFAYFLPELICQLPRSQSPRFRFMFVGSLNPGKRVDLLLTALAELQGYEFEVELVGDGPSRPQLESLAQEILGNRVVFLGVRPITEIGNLLVQADCLVLPSSHDGWGAVVSEALLAGTPVICSSACGSKVVVDSSGSGGVFETSDLAGLRNLLEAAVLGGKISTAQRQALRSWSTCLSADAGAEYLESLLLASLEKRQAPPPPWEVAARQSAI